MFGIGVILSCYLLRKKINKGSIYLQKSTL